MLITLTGSTEDSLRRLVQTGRFRSVEEAVSALVSEYDAITPNNDKDAKLIDNAVQGTDNSASFAEWKDKFARLLSLTKPRNPNVDCSRESIYPARQCEL